jgi:hypothetical protein
MNNLDEFVCFIKSAAEHLSIDEDIVFEIMRSGDEDATYDRYGAQYSMVRDAANIWNDAKRFFIE